MKTKLLSLCLILLSALAQAQNGLENIIVEKYYISNANDATVSLANGGGVLPSGSVTYRIYIDMLPGYKFQAAYGVNTPGGQHELKLATTTTFFNNEFVGATTPAFNKSLAAFNSVMLDSWLSAGAACNGNFGILKSEDNGISNVVNADGMLLNNDPSAGIPLTIEDGLIVGSPQSVTFVGITSPIPVFDNTQFGSAFSTLNGSWSSLNGASGPTATNRVLIAQMTTNGCFSFELNVQIGTPTGGVEKYVARNPVGNEIKIASLLYNSAEVSITQNPANPVCAGAGTTITYTATPINGGASPTYLWRKNGVIIPAATSSTYSSSSLTANDVITCEMTSNLSCIINNPATSNAITITTISSAPSINSFSPLSGTIGTFVTINGTGFTGVTDVKFNGVSASTFIIASATQINAIVPTNATSGRLTLFNACGIAISPSSFTLIGLENLIVEKYYISNSNDSIVSANLGGGTLRSGSTTYRLYADLLPGFKFQAVYGVSTIGAEHELKLTTSTTFFNNEIFGATFPTYSKTNAGKQSTMLDTWVSAGAACNGNFGILKSEDDGVNNVTNINGMLLNNAAAAGIPLTTQDGLIAGSPQSVTLVGITDPIPVFDNTQAGNTFSTFNGSWASLNGSSGPTAANKVLIGQFTTNGCFSFELNIQVGTPSGGTQKFVARNPVESEIMLSSLSYNVTDISIASTPTGNICPGTSVTFDATTLNPPGVPVYTWKKNGVTVGTNSASFTSNTLATGDTITCTLTSTNNSATSCVTSLVSKGIVMTVIPTLTQSVTITAGRTCVGVNSTFTAAPINSGSSPSFQWKKNGVNGGTNSPTFTTSVLANNDTIQCVLTSSYQCLTTPTATSNKLGITLLPFVIPGVTVGSNPAGPICSGTTAVFTATPSGGGSTPTYQWKKNNANVATGATYSPVALLNNDTVKCVMTSNYGCITSGNPATSSNYVVSASNCTQTISLRVFIEGFYLGGETMVAALDPGLYPTISDSITVSLVDSSTLTVASSNTNIINTSGNGSFSFTNLLPLRKYYIAIRHRNGIETYSKTPYLFNGSPIVAIDFTR